MKKIIGILGVAMIAAAMFLNTNTNNAGNNVDLASLLSINTANAECVPGYTPEWNNGRCGLTGNCYWTFNSADADCNAWG